MRIDAIPLQFLLEHRHSYPSRDEAPRVHVHVSLQFSRGYFNLLTTPAGCVPCTTVYTGRDPKKFIEDIDVAVNNSAADVQGNKSSPPPFIHHKCDACFRAACNMP